MKNKALLTVTVSQTSDDFDSNLIVHKDLNLYLVAKSLAMAIQHLSEYAVSVAKEIDQHSEQDAQKFMDVVSGDRECWCDDCAHEAQPEKPTPTPKPLSNNVDLKWN